MLFFRDIPPSPSPTESKSLFCTSVSLFLFWYSLYLKMFKTKKCNLDYWSLNDSVICRMTVLISIRVKKWKFVRAELHIIFKQYIKLNTHTSCTMSISLNLFTNIRQNRSIFLFIFLIDIEGDFQLHMKVNKYRVRKSSWQNILYKLK